MEDYLGLTIRLTLHENLIVEGIVSSLDLKTQSLTLSKAKARNNDQAPWKNQEKVIVKGSDIIDLEILPDEPTPVAPTLSASRPPSVASPSLPPPGLTPKKPTPLSASDIERSLLGASNLDSYQRVDVHALLSKQPSAPLSLTSSAPSTTMTVSPSPSHPPYDPAIVSTTATTAKPAQSTTHSHRGSIQVKSLDEDFRRLDLDTLGNNSMSTAFTKHGAKNSQPHAAKYEAGQAQWHGTDVKEYLKEDFDFEGSLKQFDKQKLFEEFRSELEAKKGKTTLAAVNKPKTTGRPADAPHDTADPSTAPLGRAPSEPLFSDSQSLLPSLPTVPALPASELHSSLAAHWNAPRATSPALAKEKTKPETKTAALRPLSTSSAPVVILKNLTCLYTMHGLCLPLMSPSQAIKVLTYATNRWGPNTVQMIENVARSFIESLATLAPGLEKVVILAGVHKIGAMGLAIGRHLTNRGIQVVAHVHGGSQSAHAPSDSEQDKDVKAFTFQKEIGLRHHMKMVFGDVNQLFVEASLDTPSKHLLVLDALCNLEEEDVEPFALKPASKLSQWLLTTEAPIFSLHTVARVQKGPGPELLYLPAQCIFSLALPSASLLPFFKAQQEAMVKNASLSLPHVVALDVGVSPHLWGKLANSSTTSDSLFAKKLTQDKTYLLSLMKLYAHAGYAKLSYHEHSN